MSADSLPERKTDVVVVGSGFSGVVTAARAIECGAEVILLEKGNRVGGTAILSGGNIGTVPEADPYVDAYEPIEEGVAWLEAHGVGVMDPSDHEEDHENIGDYHSFMIEPPQAIETLADEIRVDEDSELLLDSPMKELVTNEQGEVTGVIANHHRDGVIRITADGVILATGGSAGDAERIQRILPTDAEITLRRDPWSTGDGLKAAKDVGAREVTSSKVHSHSMAGPPAEFSVDELREASMYFETKSIALDDDGTRFADESEFNIGTVRFGEQLIRAANGTAFLVIDSDVYDSVWPHISVSSRVKNARRFGATVVEADSLDELGDELAATDVDGPEAVRTIREFNEHVRNGRGSELDPPRERLQEPMDDPPFYAVGVRAGVSFFYGGLDINANAEVIDKSESNTNIPHHVRSAGEFKMEPIPGLYAVGIEIGRPDKSRDQSNPGGYYIEGLSLGLATGRIAGKHAAERADGDE